MAPFSFSGAYDSLVYENFRVLFCAKQLLCIKMFTAHKLTRKMFSHCNLICLELLIFEMYKSVKSISVRLEKKDLELKKNLVFLQCIANVL